MTKEKIQGTIGDRVLVGVGDLGKILSLLGKCGFTAHFRVTCPKCGKFKIFNKKITSTFKHKCKVTP